MNFIKKTILTTAFVPGLCALAMIAVGIEDLYQASRATSRQTFIYEMSSQSAIAVDAVADEKPATVIVHALDEVERAQKIHKLMSLFNNMVSNDCKECSQIISEVRYGKCSESNRYLEKDLQQASAGGKLLGRLVRSTIRPQAIIKPACMKASLSLGVSQFRTCDGSGYGRKVSAPCLSEHYFNLMTNSFDAVSSCLKDYIGTGENNEMQKQDVRAVYALINLESGFQVNSVSPTGAGGIGQFTSAAIADVNMNQIPKVRKALESHNFSTCRSLSHEMLSSNEPIRSNSTNSCDRISIANGNPVKNMIYTFAYLRGIKEQMEKQIFNNKNYRQKFKLSEYDLGRVKRALMVWAHNTGPAGTLTPTKALLNHLYRDTNITDADKFIAQVQKYMQIFPARANMKPSRRKETSQYFPKVTNILNKIEQNVGGGSCVN